MGKPNKKKAQRGKQEATTEKLSKHIHRNRVIAPRGNRGNFRNFRDFPGRSAGYASYGNYDYGPYPWPKGKYSNTRPYYRPKSPRKPPSRPASPVLGSEEYMERKIQQTSAIIMEQLLNPDKQIVDNNIQALETNKKESSKNTCEQLTKTSEKPVEAVSNKNKSKKINNYKIEEIQEKIMSHIINLNDGRKKNLINSHISGYDPAIQHIQKQKRLEVSRALRDMCSKSNETQESKESSNFINSIIPDVGIKIEDIPRDLLEELRNTLNLDLECGIFEDTGNCPVGEWQTQNTNNSFINETVVPAASIKSEANDENEHSLTENEERCSNIKKSDAEKSHDINNTDSIENQRVEQVADCEYVTNTNSLVNAPVDQVPFVKLEPIEELPLVVNDTLNCTEIKEEEGLETNGTENIATISDTIKQEIKSEISQDSSDDCIIIEDEKNDLCSSLCTYDDSDKPRSEISLYSTEGNQNRNSELNNAVPGNNFSTLKPTVEVTNVATQTKKDNEKIERSIEALLTKHFDQPPRSISEAVNRMLKIDRCISKLTTYRQSLFSNFEGLGETKTKKVGNKNNKNKSSKSTSLTTSVSSLKRKAGQQMTRARNKAKKKKSGVIDNDKQPTDQRSASSIQKKNERVQSLGCEYVPNVETDQLINNAKNNSVIIEGIQQDHESTSGAQRENEQMESLKSGSVPDVTRQQNFLMFQQVYEKMLVLKVVEDKLLVAATESGKVFLCSLEDGHYITVIDACRVPITSLLFVKKNEDFIQMFIGSYEFNLLQYTIHKLQNNWVEKKIDIEDNIQCMENKWDYIFIGGVHGSILRYSIRKKKVEYADKFTTDSILVMRASQEGARRILIIGSRNSPICIRDAMTGLHIRIMATDSFTNFPTAYSLILEKNLVYSGTSNHDILVYCFHDGRLVHRLKATDSKGVSCMKVFKNLLFASCHNGSIYVYNLRDNKFIDSIAGPGGVILSMEVLTNQVIIGTMTLKFTSIPIPHNILGYLCT